MTSPCIQLMPMGRFSPKPHSAHPIICGCGAMGLYSSAVMASAAVMCLDRWERQVLMCLTTHFTAKLLKSCAVYTPTFEYLSSGQFNYPGPSVISAALLSLSFCTRHGRFVCSFIKIWKVGSRLQGSGGINKEIKKYSCSSISYAYSACPHTYTDTVHIRFLIKSFKVSKLKNVL